ncbi:hypothetical protein AB1L05_11945 [Cytobacillus horneckiae]
MTILKEAGLVAHREIGRKKAAAKYKSSIGSFYEKSWKDKATTIPQTRTKIKRKKKKRSYISELEPNVLKKKKHPPYVLRISSSLMRRYGQMDNKVGKSCNVHIIGIAKAS